MNTFGPWAHTWDERLVLCQITFSGITIPQTMIQYQTPVSNLNSSVLQRYLMSLHMDGRSDAESCYDYLANGALFYFDYTKDSESLGTYVNLNLNYQGNPPTEGFSVNDMPSNVNVFLVAIYKRDIALIANSGQ